MIRIVLSLFLAASLAACGSISHPLPKCDGYSRRPLNRAMWQWDNNEKTRQPAAGTVAPEPTSPAASYAREPASATPAAFADFDVAGSYRPCENS
ncbi:type IV secretion system protein VirB7 [Rhizobium aethiopicum]|uniref:Type IV secretion system protein VirB7 n=1 Tax=Rhizobium aethiopicum TaxID=1138170 RepID=A0A1C3YAV8_9HYPH|nr:hypothetical protein [Rhizobium aethiopicum]SCB61601.1 type IV secretion system protein VirB7 [Rhizobium aethiopicum]